MVNEIAEKYNTLNSLYDKDNRLMSGCHKITEEELADCESAIKEYMSAYRMYFPDKVFPKLHILESHAVKFMREWGYKLDKHGEQGLESCHAEFNRIKDSKRRIRNPNLRLMSAMKDYYTKNNPNTGF